MIHEAVKVAAAPINEPTNAAVAEAPPDQPLRCAPVTSDYYKTRPVLFCPMWRVRLGELVEATHASRYSKIGISVKIPRTFSYPIGTRRAEVPGNARATSPEITQGTPCTFAASSIRAAMLIVSP